MEFNPPDTYTGAKYFIENNLVFEPQKFFEKEDDDVVLTRHGIQVIRESITPQRNIGVVRVTGRDMPVALFKAKLWKNKLAEHLEDSISDGKPWEVIVIDMSSPLEWEHRRTRIGYTGDKTVNYLFILFQTCTRGTDLKGWHPHIAFLHDARKGSSMRANRRSNLNTLVQALLRVSHYTTMNGYGGPQNIRIYADINVMIYAANNDMGQYLGEGGKPPTRTSKGRPNHIVDWKFVACDADTYSGCVERGELGRGGNNPFQTKDEVSGKYMGHIRDKWNVWTYEEAINSGGIDGKSTERRIPCYKDGVCGVAFGKYVRTENLDDCIIATKASMFQEKTKK